VDDDDDESEADEMPPSHINRGSRVIVDDDDDESEARDEDVQTKGNWVFCT
jgi:hypothetical protein